jgi:hypothetical protein
LRGADLREAKVIGLDSSSFAPIYKDGLYRLHIPFLNPHESFSIQLLLSSPIVDVSAPGVIVRAKGITGVRKANSQSTRPSTTFPTVLSTALATMSVGLASLAMLRGYIASRVLPDLGESIHKDDTRDVLAVVWEMYGFTQEASVIRGTLRPITYWTEADRLTANVLAEKNPERIRLAADCLESLMQYATVHPRTVSMIYLNIACLNIVDEDHGRAMKNLAEAKSKNYKIVERRLQLDPRLAKLRQLEMKNNASAG